MIIKLSVILCFFIFNLPLLKSENIIKFIKSDGEILQMDFENIKNLNFKNTSFSNECFINLINDSSISFRTYRIKSIYPKSGINGVNSLVIDYNIDSYFGFISQLYSFSLENILSITFSNYNEFNGNIYKNISISLSGLQAIYNDDVNPKEFNKEFKVSNTGDFGDWGSQSVFCYTCYNNKISADFTFCKSNHQSSGNDFLNQTCSYYKVEIYLDTVNSIIDSIIYMNIEKDYYLPKAGGSWRDETDYYTTLNLFSLPYILQENGDLKVDIGIIDLTNVPFSYSYHNVTGSDGGYTTGNVRFLNFLPPDDSSRIRLVISSED